MSEREPIKFTPEQSEDERARYREQIKDWLDDQMSRAQGIGYRKEPTEELLEMIDDLNNTEVFQHVANMTAAMGDRETIFRELFWAQTGMVVDPAIAKYPNPEERALKRIRGLLGQWPITDTQNQRIRPDEYNSWLANRNDNHQAKAA